VVHDIRIGPEENEETVDDEVEASMLVGDEHTLQLSNAIAWLNLALIQIFHAILKVVDLVIFLLEFLIVIQANLVPL
jgi:predicted transcriptional regulator